MTKWKRLIAILLAVILALSLPMGVWGEEDDDDEDEEEEKTETKSCQSVVITDSKEGGVNVIQNTEVNVEVEVELENKNSTTTDDKEDAGQPAPSATRPPETLVSSSDLTGSAITNSYMTHVYAQPTISSRILETLRNKGESVEILAKARNSADQIWYKVKTASEVIGFIQAKYLSFQNTEVSCLSPAGLQNGAATSAGTCGNILPAGVEVEVTYVPEIVYVPQITYVPKLIYVTPAPTSTSTPTPSPAPAP